MHFVESVLVLPLLKLILSQGLQCRPQLGLYLQVLIVVIGTTSLSAFPPFSGRGLRLELGLRLGLGFAVGDVLRDRPHSCD